MLASPAYLKTHGTPKSVEELSRHSLLGFTQPDNLNQWPLHHALGASSGEVLHQLALAGVGIVCLADFMTRADRANGELVQVLLAHTVEVRQPIHAVYYCNTALASRIACFLDYLADKLAAASSASS